MIGMNARKHSLSNARASWRHFASLDTLSRSSSLPSFHHFSQELLHVTNQPNGPKRYFSTHRGIFLVVFRMLMVRIDNTMATHITLSTIRKKSSMELVRVDGVDFFTRIRSAKKDL